MEPRGRWKHNQVVVIAAWIMSTASQFSLLKKKESFSVLLLLQIETAMTLAPSPSLSLHSSFLCPPLKLKPFFSPSRIQPKPTSYPCIRAVELDQNTVVAITVGVVSVAIGIGIPVFYESQIDNASKRDNTQPCFPCSGSGAQKCRFCLGTGNVTVELGGDEKEVSRCINCDGAGSLTCTTCQGSGIQPRYLDRREFKDDD